MSDEDPWLGSSGERELEIMDPERAFELEASDLAFEDGEPELDVRDPEAYAEEEGEEAPEAYEHVAEYEDDTQEMEDSETGYDEAQAPEQDAQLADPAWGERVVGVATAELALWSDAGLKETDAGAVPLLQKYFGAAGKWVPSAKELRDRAWHEDHAWSAVFISYVVREAGAGESFTYAPLHTTYICSAKRARESGDTARFWAYPTDRAIPDVGDLVCKDRFDKGKKAGTTYDTVCGKNRKSHADIVVEIDRERKLLWAIGGNVGNRVQRRSYPLQADCSLPATAPDGCAWIAVMKPPGASPAAASSATTGNATDVVAPLPAVIGNAVRAGTIGVQVALALASGQRDVNLLTNMVFYARHPELPIGYKIRKSQQTLARDWLHVRDGIVRPLIGRLEGP